MTLKRSALLAAVRELQANSRNIRGWLDDVDAKLTALAEQLAAPPAEQPRTEPAAEPEPSFTVQPTGEWAPTPFQGDPAAPSLAQLVTPKQLGMIRALGREAGVDYEVECESVMKCKAGDLSKRAASHFIDHLKGLQERGAEFKRAS